MKLTNQRAEILDFVTRSVGHPTVEEVFEHVRKRLPRISKRTVYANLDVLAANGLVKAVCIAGVRRYEPSRKPHHHLICNSCRDIIDVELPGLAEKAMAAGKGIRGFRVLESHVHYYGTCAKCGRKRGRA
jgi:Fe2+ or Zn2+ uptake regulation protein